MTETPDELLKRIHSADPHGTLVQRLQFWASHCRTTEQKQCILEAIAEIERLRAQQVPSST